MGIAFIEVKVGNPAKPEITEKVELLVDSGATYSVIPADILRKLGIKTIGKETFRLANGDKIVRNKGIAYFKYGDKSGGCDVIFGEEGDSNLLGAFTLESLGLALDPLKRELKPIEMILAAMIKYPLRYVAG